MQELCESPEAGALHEVAGVTGILPQGMIVVVGGMYVRLVFTCSILHGSS